MRSVDARVLYRILTLGGVKKLLGGQNSRVARKKIFYPPHWGVQNPSTPPPMGGLNAVTFPKLGCTELQ